VIGISHKISNISVKSWREQIAFDEMSFSLPEEEDQENTCRSPPTREWTPGACGNAPTREWTPVPVNTHLSEFNRNVPTGSLAGLKLSGKDSSKRSVVMRYM
jgi:hypothetical protein